MSSIDPDILNELEQERTYARSGGSNTARLKIENECGALVRFLPVRMGSNKSWFARVGLHWIGRRPVVCPRTTSPAHGGDPDAPCACCSAVEKLSQARSKEVQTIANKSNAWPQWLTYVLLFETIDRDNRALAAPKHEMWTPHEFWMPKTGWLEFSATWKRQMDRNNVDILDPELGFDVLVTKSKRGDFKFELDKQGPIVDKKGAELQAFVDKLCSFKPVDCNPASSAKLDEAAMKLEDLAYGRRETTDRRGDDRSSRRVDDDDLVERRSSRFDPDEEDRAEMQAPRRAETRREEPVRESRRVEEAPPARREEPPAVRREEPPARRVEEPPPARREEPPARRVEPPPARRGVLPPESADEDVPPETRDPAPPSAVEEDLDERPPDFPPGTPVTPARASASLSSTMQDSLRRVSSRTTRQA